LVAYNVQGLLCAGIHCSSSPTFSPIKFIKVQITNKSSKEIGQPKLLLIVNKKDDNLFVCQRRSKPTVGGSLFI
jgi:hypothetical protein